MDGVSGSDRHFSRHGRRKRKMLVRHGASDPEARRRRRTRSAMRVLLPESASAIAHPSTDAILVLLNKYKTIAVVGLSSNPMRPSFGVTEYMQEAGYRIIPVNPNEREVLGEKSYARLEDVAEKKDIRKIFRGGGGVPAGGGRAVSLWVTTDFWMVAGCKQS